MAGIPCPMCGERMVAAVQYGSYLIRCPACRANFNCTSWVAVAPAYTKRMAFYREGAESDGPVIVGIPKDIWKEVWQLAADGSYLHVREADPADAEP